MALKWHILASLIGHLLIEKPSAVGVLLGHGLTSAFIETALEERHRCWRLFLLFDRCSIKTDHTTRAFIGWPSWFL
jgi:hypothetical protein